MLEIYFIANAGIALYDGEECILIDALYEGYPGFDPLPKAFSSEILGAGGPFNKVILSAVTHCHMDHYSPLLCRAFAERYPGASLTLPADAFTAEKSILDYMLKDKACTDGPLFQEFTEEQENGGLQFKDLNYEDFCPDSVQGIEGLRWGESDKAVIARIAMKHLTDRSEKVIHESLFIRFAGKTIWITGDADPVWFVKKFQNSDTLFKWLQEKKLYPADVMIVNPFFVFLKPGIRFLEKLNPAATLVYHVPVLERDDFNYREVLKLGLARCADRLPIIPLDEFGKVYRIST